MYCMCKDPPRPFSHTGVIFAPDDVSKPGPGGKESANDLQRVRMESASRPYPNERGWCFDLMAPGATFAQKEEQLEKGKKQHDAIECRFESGLFRGPRHP